ncbi:MAG TPA: RidA family protein [Tepidiformaceae bacterium]|nr:RidA family protein [Tepidiformaceae bacterium]
MTHQRISSGGPWEERGGYSRAVRAGNLVFVAGTTSANPDGTVFAPGDAYAQAVRILDIIETALAEAGASMADVVRTRMFVTDIQRFDDVIRAHGERFATTRPAATMVEVSRLVLPEMLVEIEVDAVIAEPS